MDYGHVASVSVSGSMAHDKSPDIMMSVSRILSFLQPFYCDPHL